MSLTDSIALTNEIIYLILIFIQEIYQLPLVLLIPVIPFRVFHSNNFNSIKLFSNLHPYYFDFSNLLVVFIQKSNSIILTQVILTQPFHRGNCYSRVFRLIPIQGNLFSHYFPHAIAVAILIPKPILVPFRCILIPTLSRAANPF